MKLTLLLVLLCVAGYAAGAYIPIYDSYGFSTGNFLQRPYTAVTSIFMHGSLEHLLSNIFVLLFFGLAVERELGRKKMLLVFFLGAFAGDLLSAIAYSPDTISVGASAGIFALIGIGMLLHAELPFQPAPVPLSLLGIAYALYNVYGFVAGDPQISYIAHFGGLFVGLVFGFDRKRKRDVKIIALTFLAMILIPLLWISIRGSA